MFHEVWKWIQVHEQEALKERIDAFGSPAFLKMLQNKLPQEIEAYLINFKEAKSLSNFEMGKLRSMVEEHLKEYNFL